MTIRAGLALALLGGVAVAGSALAQDDVVNVYTARHYDTDLDLYDSFTDETGIGVNIIEGDADELIERIVREGVNSPADIFMAVDAGRLWRAAQAGILAPIDSEVLNAAIPELLRDPDGLWYAMSKRARIIYYNTETVDDPSRIATYEALADPDLGYTLCLRTSNNIYNQSLLAGLIGTMGEAAAQDWAAGMVANMAREPEGNDTSQLAGAANGECDIAVANHYYFARLMADVEDPDSQAIVAALTPVFPNQGDRGAHVNISGAGVVAGAPHHEAAVRFLEFLASPEAQAYFAAGNHELPVVQGAAVDEAVQMLLDKAGADIDFTQDLAALPVLGVNNPLAVMIFDRVGWK